MAIPQNRPDPPPSTEVPPREAPSTGNRAIAVGQSVTGSALVSGDGNRIDQSHTVNNFYYAGLPEAQPPTARSDRNETTLINAVWAEVEDRLRQSLHNAILIRLDLAEQRHQVSRPWDSQLRTASQGTTPLPPNTPIAEVFDRREVGGKLLILGHPGAGKTTTMLDLAATLIQRANDDPTEPIPVMVSLSSWQNPRQSLTDWLLGELRAKYGISPKLGQTWLAAKTLLPLFDGLDELPPQRQEPVVEQINDWLRSGDGPPRLVVCSRLEEYELYAAKLALNAAICLHPLTDAQVQAYLASLAMAPLWDTLQRDADLLELVRTPLLLSVSILANDAIDLAQWQRLGATQERLDYLLDAYIARRLHDPVKSTAYPPGKEPSGKQTRRWLVWLAQQLKAQSEDEFLIEKMQPSMLANRRQKLLYRLLYGLIGGLNFMLIIGLIYDLNGRLIEGLIVGLVGGLTFALISGLSFANESITPIENVDLSFSRSARKKFFKELRKSLLYGLLYGLIFGLIFIMVVGLIFAMTNRLRFVLTVGLIYGPIFGLISGLTVGLKTEISMRVEPNQGIWSSFKNTSILLAISIAVLIILRIGLHILIGNSLESGQIDSFVSLFSSILVYGSIFVSSNACGQHFTLRLVLYHANAIPWNYARFLNHCTDRLLLQRVGGRYRFIHRLVLERFAAMPLEGRGEVDG